MLIVNRKMRKINFLKQGDQVGIVSTARKISLEEISQSISTIESWGLKVVVGKTIGLEQNQYAGTDEQRLQDFQMMLDNPEIKAIICARGGYGTVRIIDEIDFRKFLKQPKWICGFSDVTVLHSHLHSVYDIPSIHSPMLIQFSKNTPESIDTLRKALFGEKLEYEFSTHPLNRNGEAKGILVGGNLSLLHTLSGTASDINTDGKFLFIEDLDEYLYHIDRMILNLKRSGKLENLAGLIVGGMTKMKDNEIPFGKNAEEIIFDAVKEFDFPVCFNFPAGHIEDNRALIFGEKISLQISESICKLSY